MTALAYGDQIGRVAQVVLNIYPELAHAGGFVRPQGARPGQVQVVEACDWMSLVNISAGFFQLWILRVGC